MTAQKLELLLVDGLSAADVAGALAAELALVSHEAQTIERTFWDTFDGRLHGAGLTLVTAAGRLALADAATCAEQAGAIHRGSSRRLLAGDLPQGELRERVEPVIEIRALIPVARVHSRHLALDVLDEAGEIVVRLRVEEPTALSIGAEAGVAAALPARLHVAGALGHDRELAQVLALLAGKLGLTPALRPVQHDAIERLGGSVGGTSSKLRLQLEPEQRADAAAVKILRRLAEVVELNLPGTIEDVDSEFLHDLRVAVRRTRALQRELRGVFAPEPLRVFRDGFKELQRITGPTRDLDVQLLEFEVLSAGLPAAVAGDVVPLRRLLEDHLHVERRRMVRTLGARPTRALLENWSDYLDRLVQSDEAMRPDAARPVADVAGARIAQVYRRMVKRGAAIDDGSPAEALHELRKQGKELRYLLEFFQSLYPSSVVKPMVSSLKDLQDVLGRFQDREVQAGLLRSLGDEVASLEGGAAALIAMGVLVQRLVDEQAQARAQFADSFAQFAGRPQRKLVKQTFACRG